MKLPFGLCARGLTFAIAAIALSGCSGFSPIFETDPVEITDTTPQQLKLGRIQLRVAETALAHRDYEAAFELYKEAANNGTVRQAALLRLGDIHRINENLQEERQIYQTLLEENPNHTAAVSRLAALNAKADTAQPNLPKTKVFSHQPGASKATVRKPNIVGGSSTEIVPARSKPKRTKAQRIKSVNKSSSDSRFNNQRSHSRASPTNEPANPKTPSTNSTKGEKLFRVQLAAYRYKSNATRALDHFNELVKDTKARFSFLIRNQKSAGETSVPYRIRSENMITAERANSLCHSVRSTGHKCLVIRHNQRMWRSSA